MKRSRSSSESERRVRFGDVHKTKDLQMNRRRRFFSESELPARSRDDYKTNEEMLDLLECPVCLTVPRSGSMMLCPTGKHRICAQPCFRRLAVENCKKWGFARPDTKRCPMCRTYYAIWSKPLYRAWALPPVCKEAEKYLDKVVITCR